MKRLLDASSPLRLGVLALALVVCFAFWPSPVLSPEELRLHATIREAQAILWSELERRGQTDPTTDPDRSGFIGLDWSDTSTTLGNREAKQNATDPLWGVQTLRWFNAAGLARGDRIVIFSSSSFPGLLYSVLAAAESRGLKVDLVVSLGSSSWGANRPDILWPDMARILSSQGFLRTRPLFYTLGGGGETGQGMFEEGIQTLRNAARADGVELYAPPGLAAVTERKMALVTPGEAPPAKLVINIGGAHSSLGTAEAITSLQSGLLDHDQANAAGNGLIAKTLETGIPVLHFLNLRSLAQRTGISFTERRPTIARTSPWPAVAGLALFFLVLATHRRWSWDQNNKQP